MFLSTHNTLNTFGSNLIFDFISCRVVANWFLTGDHSASVRNPDKVNICPVGNLSSSCKIIANRISEDKGFIGTRTTTGKATDLKSFIRCDPRIFLIRSCNPGDILIIMGARDDTLSEFARTLLGELWLQKSKWSISEWDFPRAWFFKSSGYISKVKRVDLAIGVWFFPLLESCTPPLVYFSRQV